MTHFLHAPDPSWPDTAAKAAALWQDALGAQFIACHHIGSTAVPNLAAKPIIDLMPVATSLKALDQARPALTAAGYEAMGEFGLPGRRYFRLSGESGTRLIHAHAYAQGDRAIARHLAFRNLLRQDAQTRAAYQDLKTRADAASSGDMTRYMDLKDSFIKTHEAQALLKGF